jgi:imidazolonepropionase-like amidohydrolase
MTDVLLQGGTLFIDGDLVVADKEIRDGVIAEIGTALEAGDAATFDVTGRTVIPGLIDSHVHVAVDGFDAVARLSEPYSLPYFRAAKVLTETLSRGITTVRDAGWADLGVKRAVQTGLIDGPDMQIAVTILGETGGHSDQVTPSVAHPTLRPVTPWMPDGVVDGKDEMRKRVRELARAGADVIKICTTGGVSSPNDDPRHSQFTRGEIKAAVKEAAKHEMPVMAHAQGKEGILNAIQCGVRPRRRRHPCVIRSQRSHTGHR